MGLAQVWSVSLYGVDGLVVEIEADVGVGQPRTHLLGLPDAALHESKERVKAAVRNTQEEWPKQRIVLGLSPAALPKGGSSYDLAIACATLAADPPPGGTVCWELASTAGSSGPRCCRLLAARGPVCAPGRAVDALPEAAGRRVGARALAAEVLAWLRVTSGARTRPGAGGAATAGRPRPDGRGRPAGGALGVGGRRRRCPPPAADRSARHRQDDARRTPRGPAATPDP
ncbi:hypothetical protein BBK82_22045 [Lentzea guizhouensis]|uniref:Magnesium chelatase ChlI-like catalytic domain-containing protein n=1 Tax=Lentzea guizhouensis TaxID=1586287 RepID=A0A1B2HKV0_9PSEU|nr:hypothetical protein BBK82_22045 [Lentzea guizhouensis]